MKTYAFDATIQKVDGIDGAFVFVPYDLPRTFGAGRIKVHARFDEHPYEGSIVSSKNDDGTKDYVIGLKKDIRAAIGKQPGDSVHVEFACAQIDGEASTYLDMLRAKAEKKGRNTEEFIQVVQWLTGYAPEKITNARNVSYADWLDQAPTYNPAAQNIGGKVCGVAVAEVEDPTMHRMRVLDKLVDDLAKGKSVEKILGL
ncbi:MAG: DUF2200 family protein [Atopobiaceae bacterium]|jgi:hypothetical protein